MFRFSSRWLNSSPAWLLAVLLAYSAYGSDSGYKFKPFIPYVPTPEHVVERMLELAEVGKDDFVIDLGSGDGRIPIAAASRFGARALGVDINQDLVRQAKENAAKAGVADRVTFREQDLFKTGIRDATVVTLYVLTQVNLALRPRLLAELRPGTRVVSHAFGMGEWTADRYEDFRGVDLYFWIIPARVEGAWTLNDGTRSFTLTLEQKFQEISGSAMIEGRTVTLRNARLRGEAIEFTVDLNGGKPAVFHGNVDGEHMTGRAESGGTAREWSATRTAVPPQGRTD